jgi:hypothetical protein
MSATATVIASQRTAARTIELVDVVVDGVLIEHAWRFSCADCHRTVDGLSRETAEDLVEWHHCGGRR